MQKESISDKSPKHIAIIMDGNGRWATKRGLPRNLGHKAGIKAIERTIDAMIKFQIPVLSLFAFSTENWKRDKEEIDGIFSLVRDYLSENKDSFLKKGVRVVSMGDIKAFPDDLVSSLESVQEETKNNDKLTLNLALNYGGRADIIRAVNEVIKDKKTKIDEKDFEKYLYSYPLPDPDLVIRTSGEMRLSNFMMYQLAYCELYFTPVLWPDFGEKDLKKAIIDFQKRERRFGGNK